MKYATIFLWIVLPLILTACGGVVPTVPAEKPAATTVSGKKPLSNQNAKANNSYAMCTAMGFISSTDGCINVNRISDSEVCSGKDNEFCGKNINDLCKQVGRKVRKPFIAADAGAFTSMQSCIASCSNNPFDPCMGSISNN